MKKISTLLFTLVASLFFNHAFSQALYPVSLSEKVQQSTFIVEGTVVSKQSFWNPAHSMIYTSNRVKLHKIFKGENNNESFIEILTIGGAVGTDQIEASDLADFSVGETGLFFCFPNSIHLKNPATNYLLWDVYSSAQGFIRYDLNSKIADAPFAEYSNIKNKLYPDVITKTGRNYLDVDPQFVISEHPTPQTEALAITSFSPVNVVAGASADVAQNLLTINGTDFGNAAGTAAVLFDDANNGTGGTPFTVAYNDPLMVSWTNTQIQVRVPSRAGTGTFQVRDELGNSVTSASGINVLYSILAAGFTGYTAQSNLMNDDGLGGYSIVYSTSTAGSGVDLNASPVKATFQRALQTWKEVKGANITEAGTTTVQAINPSNGLNIIMFDNANTGLAPLAAGVLGVCYSFNSTCTPLGTTAVRKVEFDISIRNNGFSTGTTPFENGPCYPATDGSTIDMETVLLHELGHALNLGHINDTYQYTGSGGYAAVNPSKLMHYAVIVGVARKNLDWSANIGTQYAIQPKGLNYGTCVAAPFNTEMTPLSTSTEAKDECPGSFPTSATPNNTMVSFDLVHATSNKNVDPQFTAVTCTGAGRPVTNTAYYPIRTSGTGNLSITVSGYSTSPADQALCSNAGVKLALYQVSNCPTGQAFPTPVACESFNGDGFLIPISGLAANSNYLIFVDGENNTKATFNLILNGTALPVRINNFNGTVKPNFNEIYWNIDMAATVKLVVLEASLNGTQFTSINEQLNSIAADRINSQFEDASIANKKYYRLKMINLDGSIEYSNVLLLRRDVKANTVLVTPNPATDHVNILLNRNKTATLTFKLTDVSGKVVFTKSQTVAAGTQTLQLNQLGNLAAGTYILNIWDGETNSAHRMVKQ